MRINPQEDIFNLLMQVEKPGRYAGGEYGCIQPDASADLRVVLCFPDLYEIGMSNLAVRIMYQLYNSVDGVSCERVFAPAKDFERLLRDASVPLYSLESGTPLGEFDVVAFSIGYELAATNILAVLETGGVPARNEDRGSLDPIVIAGGPSITNPLPFSKFIDAIFIGEAESAMAELLGQLAALKRRGAGRESLLETMQACRHVYASGKKGAIERGVWDEFGTTVGPSLLPVPGIKTVQDHGVVEIMRGCPNGCRFCHAGFFYRPFREKEFALIDMEVENLISICGYREITITSLSSGDFSNVVPVVSALNRKYGSRGVSFSLPSLRIDSFTLPLLAEISAVRKSGLTFAVETPVDDWQRGINKTVGIDKTVEILLQAKKLGWRFAKFYFMIGLPVSHGRDEVEPIALFLEDIRRRTGMHINVNVGTFVPKPHTPFQWAPQLREYESLERITRLKSRLRSAKIDLRYHSPFASELEGIITRGDERVAGLIEDAYKRGARFDAWEEQLDRQLWKEVLNGCGWDPGKEFCSGVAVDKPLIWDGIRIGVSKQFLKEELERSEKGVTSSACGICCGRNCGVCGNKHSVRTNSGEMAGYAGETSDAAEPQYAGFLIFSYEKKGRAVFLSHLNVMSIFERAFQRSGLRVKYTQGFNPKPKLEFASPLPLGFCSTEEIGRVEIIEKIDGEEYREKVNLMLHDGIHIICCKIVDKPSGKKLTSLMAGYWGSDYLLEPVGTAGENFSAKLELLSRYVAENMLGEDIAATGEGGSICLRVRQAGKKTSLRTILSIMCDGGAWWDELKVTRQKCYAGRPNGAGETERVSFLL